MSPSLLEAVRIAVFAPLRCTRSFFFPLFRVAGEEWGEARRPNQLLTGVTDPVSYNAPIAAAQSCRGFIFEPHALPRQPKTGASPHRAGVLHTSPFGHQQSSLCEF